MTSAKAKAKYCISGTMKKCTMGNWEAFGDNSIIDTFRGIKQQINSSYSNDLGNMNKPDLSNLDYTQFYWEGLRSNLLEKGFSESMFTNVRTMCAIIQIVLNATYLQRIWSNVSPVILSTVQVIMVGLGKLPNKSLL